MKDDNVITKHDWKQGKMVHTAICLKCGAEREIAFDSTGHFIIPPCQPCAIRKRMDQLGDIKT